jgi:hypothetical protein
MESVVNMLGHPSRELELLAVRKASHRPSYEPQSSMAKPYARRGIGRLGLNGYDTLYLVKVR